MKRKNQPAATTPSNASDSTGIGELLQKHRTLTRLVMAVLVPALILGAAEGVLRLASFGYPTHLFLKVEGATTYGMNRQFGWRFFPREIARKPVPQSFQQVKSKRTCRIFTLGASAALSLPNSAFSFTRSLEVMLKSRYPGVKFELVNTALTAINSHVVLPIAQECADYEPDVYLIYLGNNEVIGPYSIGGSSHGVAGNLLAIRAGIALRTTCLGQLGQRLVAGTKKSSLEDEQWRGMQMYSRHIVRSDAPQLTSVHENFRSNLHDICVAGLDGGAKVVLSTVAVNLRDSPPFASVADSTAPAAQLARLASLTDAAQQLLAAGNPAAALDSLLLARDLDASVADIHFLLGKAALALGQNTKARQGFADALEYDALRFRTDRQLNRIIRETAAELTARGVILADTEQQIRSTEPSGTGIPGQELFYEHVHLTFAGNYEVARALLPAVEQALPDWVKAKVAQGRSVPTQEQCGQALLYTPANKYFNLSQMYITLKP